MSGANGAEQQVYELAVILHPDLEIDLKASGGKIEKIIKASGGKVISKDMWDKQKLAYEVAGQGHGLYAFYKLELPPNKTKEVEEALKLSDEVMRFLLVKFVDIEDDSSNSKSAPKAGKKVASQ